MEKLDCIIVGAGLAGLACCRTLTAAGRRVRLLEAAAEPGGRVATDTVDGFRIDRGFQVYLDAYPEGLHFLDHGGLQLGCFEPGALVARNGRLLPVSDPWRRPVAAIRSVLTGTVGITDGLRTARLRSEMIRGVRQGRIDPAAAVPTNERTTRAALKARGFSTDFIRMFFEPFFGGVFLERELATAETVFGFTFAMFSQGRACLPAGGMAAIPRQLAASLPAGSIELGVRVTRLEHANEGGGVVTLSDGRKLEATTIVIATDATAAAALLPASLQRAWQPPAFKATTLVAFAAPRQPACGQTLIVSAESVVTGPIDNLTVPSAVASGYAPAGQSLIYASVRGDWQGSTDDLSAAIQRQAASWLGSEVEQWRHLTSVMVPQALPVETPAVRCARPRPLGIAPGLFLCGDYLTTSSINGALHSGRIVAEEVLAS